MFNQILAAVAAGGMMIAAPALAGEAAAPVASVSYADLDLTSAKGQAELEKRVASAARKMCEANDINTGTRLISSDKRRCLDNARKSARSQVAAIIEDARRGG